MKVWRNFRILAHSRRVKNFYASRFGNVNVTNTLGVIMQLRDTALPPREEEGRCFLPHPVSPPLFPFLFFFARDDQF